MANPERCKSEVEDWLEYQTALAQDSDTRASFWQFFSSDSCREDGSVKAYTGAKAGSRTPHGRAMVSEQRAVTGNTTASVDAEEEKHSLCDLSANDGSERKLNDLHVDGRKAGEQRRPLSKSAPNMAKRRQDPALGVVSTGALPLLATDPAISGKMIDNELETSTTCDAIARNIGRWTARRPFPLI
ncbi:hypothetical protein BDV96DRAFT_643969 [Lophiotrema nucula]|uniref:Uncharacterized protein n=1 Tax=Lophiotrema nucula TaxID=690887 RepID=A0A6A5ZDI8_9PLEO|nr:hypothetical protein BDV96DRAFT_643969 [Lophiotrema nucula]